MIIIGRICRCHCGGMGMVQKREKYLYIKCMKCGQGWGYSSTLDEAIEHWNTKDKYDKSSNFPYGMSDFELEYREMIPGLQDGG